MSNCTHELPLSQKVLASRSRNRKCLLCGKSVYVYLPIFNGLLSVSVFFMAFLFVFAWVDGGGAWIWFAIGIVIHIGIYFAELHVRNPMEFDNDSYHRHTKRNLAILVGIVVVAAGLLFWAA